ncbi:EmrB/QacA subfamily drug resistance transporter [Methanomicrobium sp. W14]|uniref:MFS transporter n=1 Tax=Methanomicrobium sp. W14 TaxID=2817839 RepID=UPI001AE1FB0A|nr:MFS transporter [Methanomicrobium sp. W14]MBP2133396.1 EmrB/QacA subfamily drug resistance transporter [Methanomicrobium sp. W14]
MDSRQKAILLITSLGSFLTPFMGSSINIAITQIGLEFTSNAILLAWVPTSYLLVASIFIVPMGRLADMKGRAPMFLAGIVIYTIGSLLCTLVPSVEYLIMCRFVQGFGAAMIFGTAIAIITRVIPPEHRGTALGINVAFVYSGLTLGPFIGGFITEFLGWRSIFYANAIIGIIVFVSGMKYLRFEEIKDNEAKFDLTGSVLYALMILFVMVGFQEMPDTSGFILFALSALSFIGFVIRENRTKYPVFQISLFTKNRVFAFSNLAAFINYSATFAISFLLSIYLQTIEGFDSFTAGTILIAQPILQTVLSPLTGKLSDKYDSAILSTSGMVIITAGLMMFAFLKPSTSVFLIIINLAILGTGYALFSSPNTHAVMNSVDERKYGVASGVLGTMRMCGMMSSMGISMLAFSLTIGEEVLAEADVSSLMHAINLAFAIFVVLCIIGTFASYIRNPKKDV